MLEPDIDDDKDNNDDDDDYSGEAEDIVDKYVGMLKCWCLVWFSLKTSVGCGFFRVFTCGKYYSGIESLENSRIFVSGIVGVK